MLNLMPFLAFFAGRIVIFVAFLALDPLITFMGVEMQLSKRVFLARGDWDWLAWEARDSN